MLYICGHLTKIIIPATQQTKLQRISAGLVQEAIQTQIGGCIHDPTIQETSLGRLRLAIRQETSEERLTRIQTNLINSGLKLTAEAAEAMWDINDIQQIISAKAFEEISRHIVIHDSIINPNNGKSLEWADIKDDFNFGNGVTCNSSITLKDDTKIPASWCLLLTNVGDTIFRDLSAMRVLESCFTGE